MEQLYEKKSLFFFYLHNAGAETERPGCGRRGGQGKSVPGHADQGSGTIHARTPTFRHHDIQGAHAAVRPEQTGIDRRVPEQGAAGQPQRLGRRRRRRHAVAHRQSVQPAAGHHGRHRGHQGEEGPDENVADRGQGKDVRTAVARRREQTNVQVWHLLCTYYK